MFRKGPTHCRGIMEYPLTKWTLFGSEKITWTLFINVRSCQHILWMCKNHITLIVLLLTMCRYNVIILVGGGIGVTPLLAVLQDILHRKRLGQDNLPSSIHLHHCVRKQEELCVLNSVDPNHILPQYEKQGLDIRVNAYVTSPTCKSSERNDDKDDQKTLDLATFGGSPAWQQSNSSPDLCTNKISTPISMNTSQSRPIQGICAISTSGNSKWVFLTILASIVGFYIIWGLSNVLLIKKYDALFPNYHRAHLVVASMVLGISVFGGMIILLWWSQSKVSPKKGTGYTGIALPSLLKVLQKPSSPNSIGGTGYPNASQPSTDNQHYEPEGGLTNDIEKATSLNGSPWNGNLHLQSRPDWRGILTSHLIFYFYFFDSLTRSFRQFLSCTIW